MEKERKLYNKFVDKLLTLLDNTEISDKELRIILNFIESQNIQALPDKNEGLRDLIDKLNNEIDLPFSSEEVPTER